MITYNYSDVQRYTSKQKYLIEIIKDDINRFEQNELYLKLLSEPFSFFLNSANDGNNLGMMMPVTEEEK